ncbi:VasL domain-containing protein, partial [Xenorhabdus entomophaga]|uniref:VasL domain-containing protein n=1 Tax=Xenorhabdus entomophaga TaxID=3136257 RepID=UPI0030F3DEF9
EQEMAARIDSIPLKGNWHTTRDQLQQLADKILLQERIDVTTGMLFDQRIDIELGQTIPLTFMRSWSPGERGL